MAAKKTASKSDKRPTKTGFIRSMSPDVGADEVIAKAKEQGIELTKKLVWTTQSEMRGASKTAGKKGKKAPKGKKAVSAAQPSAASASAALPTSDAKPARNKPGPKPGFRLAAAKAAAKAAAAPAKAGNGSTAEQKLKALVIELGTTRADEVYRSVRAQLSAILG